MSAVPEVDEDDFRRAMARFVTGVCVVTTTAGGQDYAMTVNTLTSVSLDPLIVLVCLDVDARVTEAVAESGVWGVSVLPVTERAAAAWLAQNGRPLQGQLDRVALSRGPATGVPLLVAALSTIECATVQTHRAGDHDVVVGEVRSVGAPAPQAEPLLWFRGGYTSLRHPTGR
ncbi:flavin reductase (DIM6/NTAB) family NADH-FMN oxidoreductase RutF [Motilibacter peucedani]|uniref:Flavin reductase (DIM6/NTAB) family NADH-FMN oxidoreductase RutF n=1 Tax=Motilibacter peucedani TaxID=598650 RepID=A0A420XMG1_9ACTN|nr:flavin reductase family protein [Motilibacter peucedani]RKS72422.1 flavin reductase (DIM6/NTAB) family NADH-FMN oxidoreductase RutF [Motilibacter peucedani]